VTTASGTATSAAAFSVTGGAHQRNISLNLSGHLYASGQVTVSDGYQACLSQIPVVIKRYHNGQWKWLATTATRTDGTYRAYLHDHRGTYRARAKKITLANGVTCGGDKSNTVTHHG
jgi:hypothetical protein